MADTENLLEQLIQRINTHLDLCQESETPIICSMLDDKQSRKKVVDLAVKKVVEEKLGIAQAIIAINDEFDPNHID